MAKIKTVVTLVFLFLNTFLYTQAGKIRFKHLSVVDGLSHGAVICIWQDRKGFMWFGTQDGLNRYDGYKFKVFRHIRGDKKSLSDNFVLCISKDHEGFIWVGTKAGGVNRVDPNTEEFTRYRLKAHNETGFSTMNVKVIHEDKARILWVGTEDGGLWILDRKTGLFDSYQSTPENFGQSINVLYEDQEKTLWVGTETGLYWYDRRAGKFHPYESNSKNSHVFTGKNITAISEEKNGTFWIGTRGNGLFKLDRKTGDIVVYSKKLQNPYHMIGDSINCLYHDRNNILWVGSEGELSRLYPGAIRFIHDEHNPGDRFSPGDGEVLSIFQDEEGIVWVGAYGDGVNVYDPDFNQFYLYYKESGKDSNLSGNSIWAILEDKDGMLWIGTYMEGLNRLDRKTGKYKLCLPNKDVRCIYEDLEGSLIWIGTKGEGLFAIDPTKGEPIPRKMAVNDELKNDEITCISKGGSGKLWIGARYGGLISFDPKNNTYMPLKNDPNNLNSLSYNFVRAILKDSKGTLWIGTEGGGLNRFVPGKNEFVRYLHQENDPGSLSHNRIKAIYEDKKKRLWIGTEGGGVNVLNHREKGIFKSYRQKHGLANNTVYGILEDDKGNLWMSTNKGLSRFDPNTETFKNYNAGDGLQSNEFNTGAYFKSKKTGEMFFGGDKGLNAFFPYNIKTDCCEPSVVITGFSINNGNNESQLLRWKTIGTKPRAESAEKTLNYKQNIISFEFAALRYSNPSKNEYKYKLEGYDNDWIKTDAENRRATYMNLPPGKYTFMVQGSNKDGKWNEKGASVKLRVLPPPWETWWAYCLYGMAFIGIVFLFIRYQRRKTAKKLQAKEELERKVKERTKFLEKIDMIVRSINAEMQFSDLLKKILKETIVIKGVQKASVLVWDTESKQYYFKSTVGFDLKQLEKIIFSGEEADTRYINGSDKIEDDIFIIRDASKRPHSNKIMPELLPKSMLIMRISIENKTQAYFIFENIDNENAFADQDIQLLQKLKFHIVEAFQKTHLIHQLQEKNKELQETSDQLIQTEKLSSLGTLLAGIAHELFNPAGTIMLTAEWFSKAWKDITPLLDQLDADSKLIIANMPYNESREEIEKLISGLLDSSRRIKNLLEELKKFSRKEDRAHKETIDIHTIIRSVLDLTRNVIKKSTDNFSLDFGKNIPLFKGNPQRLTQVFINLIRNACEALPDNIRGISISTSYHKKTNEILIQVKDEGEGIEEQSLSKITDPFYTTRRSTGGMGLGLSISRKIIHDEHQGRMIFESRPGKGTTVLVYLPVKPFNEKIDNEIVL